MLKQGLRKSHPLVACVCFWQKHQVSKITLLLQIFCLSQTTNKCVRKAFPINNMDASEVESDLAKPFINTGFILYVVLLLLPPPLQPPTVIYSTEPEFNAHVCVCKAESSSLLGALFSISTCMTLCFKGSVWHVSDWTFVPDATNQCFAPHSRTHSNTADGLIMTARRHGEKRDWLTQWFTPACGGVEIQFQ